MQHSASTENSKKTCPSSVILFSFLFGTAGGITLLNFLASYIGYGVMLLFKSAPHFPASSATNVASYNNAINFTFSNITISPPKIDYTVCIPKTGITSANDVANITVLGTSIAMSAYALAATFYIWFVRDKQKEIAKEARTQSIAAIFSNICIGPIATGLTGFFKYCVNSAQAAQLMGPVFFGVTILTLFGGLVVGAYKGGIRCAEKIEDSESSPEANQTVIEIQDTTPVQIFQRSSSHSDIVQPSGSGDFVRQSSSFSPSVLRLEPDGSSTPTELPLSARDASVFARRSSQNHAQQPPGHKRTSTRSFDGTPANGPLPPGFVPE